ncbi:GIN domain-containing protein [Flavobacterium sp. SM2513]|uniref:GIN domain-containing protein n=1 Tax=Flavobacterium sp. SM2513 TaxID=3424766 RepID=UPI003D7FFBE6
MKQTITLLVFLFICTISLAQKGEKLKGSKTVTTQDQPTPVFTDVYIQDDIEVSFIKADSTGIETEADDNLHEALKVTNAGGVLNLSMANKISRYKKFEVKIFYTDALKSIEAIDDSKVMILEEMELDNVSFKLNNKAKLFLNLKAKVASFELNDDSEVQLNAKSEKLIFILTNSSTIKALVAAQELKVDQYQKSTSAFEGDVVELKLRMDNNAKFVGSKLTSKKAELLAEGYSDTKLQVETSLILSAFANAEIELFGEPSIELKKFTGKSLLKKNTLK